MKLSLNDKYTKLRKDYVKLQKEHDEFKKLCEATLIEHFELQEKTKALQIELTQANERLAEHADAQPHCNDSGFLDGNSEPAKLPAKL